MPKEIPNEYLCVIDRTLLVNPVKDKQSEDYYEKDAIFLSLQAKAQSPTTRVPWNVTSKNDLKVDVDFQKKVYQFALKNKDDMAFSEDDRREMQECYDKLDPMFRLQNRAENISQRREEQPIHHERRDPLYVQPQVQQNPNVTAKGIVNDIITQKVMDAYNRTLETLHRYGLSVEASAVRVNLEIDGVPYHFDVSVNRPAGRQGPAFVDLSNNDVRKMTTMLTEMALENASLKAQNSIITHAMSHGLNLGHQMGFECPVKVEGIPINFQTTVGRSLETGRYVMDKPKPK